MHTMKTWLASLVVLFAALTIRAQVRTPGVLTNGGNAYPVTTAPMVAGAPQIVATTTAMSNTPSWLRVEGQLFHVLGGSDYRLVGGTNNANFAVVIPSATATNALPHAFSLRGYTHNATNIYWPVIDVRDFGARGDDMLDDTVALQTAINWSTNGGEVYLPAGSYRITNTLSIPTSGADETNRIVIRGDGRETTLIEVAGGFTGADSNKHVMECVSIPNTGENIRNTFAHFEMRKLCIVGPLWDAPQPAYSSPDVVPYRGACLFVGYPGVWQEVGPSGGNLINGTYIKLDEVRLCGSFYGLCISNISMGEFKWCHMQKNAYRNMMLSHVDSTRIEGGQYGSPYVTNYYTFGKEPYSFEFCGTGYADAAGADSGVHNFIENIEHYGPFLMADNKRLTVQGGQFETDRHAQLTNGWSRLTNNCQITFIQSSFSLGVGHSNMVVFDCWRSAAAGLKLINCGLGWDPTRNEPNLLFRITSHADYPNFQPPYWLDGASGFSSGQEQSAAFPGNNVAIYNNCLWRDPVGGVTNYVNVRQGGVDYLNVSTLRDNGRQFVMLPALSGTDELGNPPMSETNYWTPSIKLLSDYFTSFSGPALSYSPAVETVAHYWRYAPVVLRPNPDGTMAKRFRLTVPVLSNTNWSYPLCYAIFSLNSSGAAQVQGGYPVTWTYNTPGVVSNWLGNQLTFPAAPASPVVVYFGYGGSWAITNTWHFFDAKLEYW